VQSQGILDKVKDAAKTVGDGVNKGVEGVKTGANTVTNGEDVRARTLCHSHCSLLDCHLYCPQMYISCVSACSAWRVLCSAESQAMRSTTVSGTYV
jgi:hypothetical protein